MKSQITMLLAALSLGLGSGPLLAQVAVQGNDQAVNQQNEELADTKEMLREAADVVQKMNQDEDARGLLNRAKAVFLVPDYARGSFIAGAAGGQGVLFSRTDQGWSGPAFYNIGAISFGATAGFEAGPIAFMMMTQDALDAFNEENNFSLNADAGLTVVSWSNRAQAAAGKGADVVVWSGAAGLYGDLAVSVTDIFWDDEANAAYYGNAVQPGAIILGKVKDPNSDDRVHSEFSALEKGQPGNGNQGSQTGSGNQGSQMGSGNQGSQTSQPASDQPAAGTNQ
jgi:lipid-binding SYLF domain-containing protein